MITKQVYIPRDLTIEASHDNGKISLPLTHGDALSIAAQLETLAKWIKLAARDKSLKSNLSVRWAE